MKIHLKMFSLARNQPYKSKLKVDYEPKHQLQTEGATTEDLITRTEMTNLKSFSRSYISKRKQKIIDRYSDF